MGKTDGNKVLTFGLNEKGKVSNWYIRIGFLSPYLVPFGILLRNYGFANFYRRPGDVLNLHHEGRGLGHAHHGQAQQADRVQGGEGLDQGGVGGGGENGVHQHQEEGGRAQDN